MDTQSHMGLSPPGKSVPKRPIILRLMVYLPMSTCIFYHCIFLHENKTTMATTSPWIYEQKHGFQLLSAVAQFVSRFSGKSQRNIVCKRNPPVRWKKRQSKFQHCWLNLCSCIVIKITYRWSKHPVDKAQEERNCNRLNVIRDLVWLTSNCSSFWRERNKSRRFLIRTSSKHAYAAQNMHFGWSVVLG